MPGPGPLQPFLWSSSRRELDDEAPRLYPEALPRRGVPPWSRCPTICGLRPLYQVMHAVVVFSFRVLVEPCSAVYMYKQASPDAASRNRSGRSLMHADGDPGSPYRVNWLSP